MKDSLRNYIMSNEKEFVFKIWESSNDDEYEKITRPLLKKCVNPDGSGPNKSRVPDSKITDGFVYITAVNSENEIVGASSFQIYRLKSQAIPKIIYIKAAKAFKQNMSVKDFIKENKDRIIFIETHRLLSVVRGKHLAATMIHKLENYIISNYLKRKFGNNIIPIFFETVNEYSKKAFELCEFDFSEESEAQNTKIMGGKTKYIGGKYEYIKSFM